jgi:hypothetical protein
MVMNKRLMAAVVLAVAVAGCATSKPFYKAGAGAAEFEQDKQQCLYEAQLHQPNDPLMWLNTVPQCLRARGWTR